MLPIKTSPADMGNGLGDEIYQWVVDLFPHCRSLTGPGTLKTLEYFQGILPGLTIHAVPSGTRAGDWVVPDEWTIRDAFVKDADGKRVIDFQKNNLHVIGYSEPVDSQMTLEELQPHLRLTSAYQRQFPITPAITIAIGVFACPTKSAKNCQKVHIMSKLIAS